MPRSQRPTKMSGESQIYNNVDEIWKFELQAMEIKDENLAF
jgi:hypothetical protein